MNFKEYLTESDWVEFNSTLDRLIECKQNQILTEGIIDSLSSKLKGGIEFIKSFAKIIKLEFVDALILFKNKLLFSFFNKIKWSLKSFINIIKEGYKLNSKLQDYIAKYISDNKIVKWTNENLKNLDDWLNEHKWVKRAGILVVVGFLIYQWTSMISFTGDIEFDFDQTTLFQAIIGNFSLADLFSTADGVKMLMFIAVGTLTGLSFPWPGDTWVLFGISIIYTIAKHKHPQIAKSIIKNVKKYKSYTTLKI